MKQRPMMIHQELQIHSEIGPSENEQKAIAGHMSLLIALLAHAESEGTTHTPLIIKTDEDTWIGACTVFLLSHAAFVSGVISRQADTGIVVESQEVIHNRVEPN